MSIEQNVNHPAYYGGKDNPYETIKVIEAWGLDDNFDLGNTIKYISRAGKKDKACLLQDLMKAQFYLNHEVEKLHKYDGNYEKMKADERKARLLDEKKELEEELDDLVSKFEKSDPIHGEGIIYDYVSCDDLIKAINKYKKELSDKEKEISNADDSNSNADDSNSCDCDHAEEYACEPDECKECKYSDCACDEYGVHTIEIPDDVWAAINTVADYFLDNDSDDDYEICVTDDGALVIAPSSYGWEDLEDF